MAEIEDTICVTGLPEGNELQAEMYFEMEVADGQGVDVKKVGQDYLVTYSNPAGESL